MKRFFILFCALVLVIAFSVSASAANLGQKIYYLYRDFEALTVNDDGTINRRLNVPLSDIYYYVTEQYPSGVWNDAYIRNFGPSISFTGSVGSLYWVDTFVLGSLTSEPWMEGFSSLNVISLDGFMSNARIGIGYSITGANIADDHHDVWIYYFDQNLNYTEKIQYQGTVSTTGGRRFLVDVPIGVGSNVNNSYFAVVVQIDDIVPVANGTVTLNFEGITLTTFSSASGGNIWEPIFPDRPNFDQFDDVHDAENSISQTAKDLFSQFSLFVTEFPLVMQRFSACFSVIGGVLSKLLEFEVFQFLVVFSVVWGVVAMVYSMADFAFSRHSSKKTKASKHKNVKGA